MVGAFINIDFSFINLYNYNISFYSYVSIKLVFPTWEIPKVINIKINLYIFFYLWYISKFYR